MRILRSQAGITIIETIVAVGLMGLAAFFFMSILKTGASGQKSLQAQDDARVLTDNIATLLSDSVACSNTFGGLAPSVNTAADPVAGTNWATVGTNGIVDGTAAKTVQFSVGKVYGNRNLTLKEITIGGPGTDAKTQIQKWVPLPPPPAPPSTGTAFVQLTWSQYDPGHDSHQGPQDLVRFFMLNVTAMTGNTISHCMAQAATSSSTNYWSPAANGVDIYSNTGGGAGKVGIGTPNPTALLHVEGSGGIVLNAGNVGIGTTSPTHALTVMSPGASQTAYIGSSTRGLFTMDDGTNVVLAATNPNVTSNHPLKIYSNGGNSYIYVAPAGNIGIGTSTPDATLEVAGPVHPGNAGMGTACTAVGALASDSASGAPLYCKAGVPTPTWTAVAMTCRNVSAVSSGSSTVTAACLSTETLMGGGCDCTDPSDLPEVKSNLPGTNSWTCVFVSTCPTSNRMAYANCCKT